MKKIILIIVVLVSFIWADRLSRDLNGIVTDKVTQLQWQDDYSDNGGNIFKLLEANWEIGINYCEALNLDGIGWRVPNINELYSIVDYETFDPAINPVFVNTENYTYLSSTTLLDWGGLTSVQMLSFDAGDMSQGRKNKSWSYVRCVRGGR